MNTIAFDLSAAHCQCVTKTSSPFGTQWQFQFAIPIRRSDHIRFIHCSVTEPPEWQLSGDLLSWLALRNVLTEIPNGIIHLLPPDVEDQLRPLTATTRISSNRQYATAMVRATPQQRTIALGAWDPSTVSVVWNRDLLDIIAALSLRKRVGALITAHLIAWSESCRPIREIPLTITSLYIQHLLNIHDSQIRRHAADAGLVSVRPIRTVHDGVFDISANSAGRVVQWMVDHLITETGRILVEQHGAPPVVRFPTMLHDTDAVVVSDLPPIAPVTP